MGENRNSTLRTYIEIIAYDDIFQRLSAHINLDADGLCDSHNDAWDAEIEYDVEDMRVKALRDIIDNGQDISFELLVETDINVRKTSRLREYDFVTTKWYKLNCIAQFSVGIGIQQLDVDFIELYGGSRK